MVGINGFKTMFKAQELENTNKGVRRRERWGTFMSFLLLVDVYFTLDFLDAKLNVMKLIVIEYGYDLF